MSALNLVAGASEVFTIAGTGAKGFAGDDGPAAAAQFNNVSGLVRGPDGALFIADTDNQRIRRIVPDGKVSTVAGNGTRGYSGDGGPATLAQLNDPYEVRFDKAGNLFIVERLNHAVRRVDAKTGVVSTVAGTGKAGFSGDGGPANAATLHEPHSIQFGPDGSLYICDVLNQRIRKVDVQTGIISTFAGNGTRGAAQDGSKFADAPLNGPRAIDFDAVGNLWLALREGNAVYKLDLKTGTMQRAAGTGVKGFSGNGGPALQAALNGPKCVSVAPDGNVYLADTESHSIRMINVKTGNLELVAGTGSAGNGPDGDPLLCKLARPHGVFVDKDGAVYIGDSENHRVRVLHGK